MTDIEQMVEILDLARATGAIKAPEIGLARMLMGLTQEQASEEMGVSYSAIRAWEQDRRSASGLYFTAVLSLLERWLAWRASHPKAELDEFPLLRAKPAARGALARAG